MIIDVEGIVISSTEYKDTSKVINIFTQEYGIIGVLAKGCKSLKSHLRSVTDNLTYATFTIYYKKDKLSLLSEAVIINNFSIIKKDIEKISYASYMLDLAKQVYKQNENSNIYSLLISALLKLNENMNEMIICNILELKYLEYLGIMPNLNGCSVCSNKEVITLSSSKGGYVCKSCHTNEFIINSKSIKLIRMYYYVDINKITKLDINSSVIKEVNDFIDEYYELYSGLYLKSKNFIKNIYKLNKYS